MHSRKTSRGQKNAKQTQTTVRLNVIDKAIIDQIQAETDLSQPVILHRAIELLQRQRLSAALQADFEALATDKKALRLYRQESSLWDKAAGDGLRGK